MILIQVYLDSISELKDNKAIFRNLQQESICSTSNFVTDDW